MKALISMILLLGNPLFVAHAQTSNDSFDLDLDPIISEELGDKSGSLSEKSPTPSIKADAKQNRSIYIVNQASSGAKSDAKSKTEQNDTAYLGSRAEELRKNRQRAEVETEMKASEKIEESRLSDERRRSEALFGDRLNDTNSSNEQRVAPIIVQPVQAPVVAPVANGVGREELREDLKNILAEKEELKKEKSSTNSYFIGMLGLSEFPKANNIQGNGLFGIGFGVEAQERVLVEGMFQYASYQSNYIWLKNIDEYSGSLAIKAQFSKGSIRPLAGALAVYSYRTYTDTYQQYQYGYGNSQQSKVSVLDVGLTGGAQFAVSEGFLLGAEFRYLWNLTSKKDPGTYYPVYIPNSEPLDDLSHYSFVVTGRFNF